MTYRYKSTVPRHGNSPINWPRPSPLAVAAACVEFLYGPLAENPLPVAAPLRKPFEGYWRVRRGEYRVRYTIDDSTHTVRVLDISPRRDAYH